MIVNCLSHGSFKKEDREMGKQRIFPGLMKGPFFLVLVTEVETGSVYCFNTDHPGFPLSGDVGVG